MNLHKKVILSAWIIYTLSCFFQFPSFFPPLRPLVRGEGVFGPDSCREKSDSKFRREVVPVAATSQS